MRHQQFRSICGLRYIFLSFAAITFIAGSGSAQYRNTITGFVFAPDRSPVTQVPVELANEVQQVLLRTKTDGTGRYFFSGISAGRFTVRVMPFGTNYEEQSGEVEIINFVRAGSQTSDSAHKDIYLRHRRSGPSKSLTGTLYAQEVPADAQKLYQSAVSQLENNRTDAGIQTLLDALKVFPDYYLALERLGREYIAKQNYEYAHAVYLKTVSVNERSFNGWYGLAYSSYGLKRAEVAIEAAEKAVTIDPSSVDAMIILGISQRQAKRFDDAEKTLLRARKASNGMSSDVHWNLALLYANNLKRYKDAADELERFLKIAPNDIKIDEVKRLIAKFREKARVTA